MSRPGSPRRKQSSCERDISTKRVTPLSLAVTSPRAEQRKAPLSRKSRPPSNGQLHLQGIAVQPETVVWFQASSLAFQPRVCAKFVGGSRVTSASKTLMAPTGARVAICQNEMDKQALPRQQLKRRSCDTSCHPNPRIQQRNRNLKRKPLGQNDDLQVQRVHREHNFCHSDCQDQKPCLYHCSVHQDHKHHLNDGSASREHSQRLKDRLVNQNQKQCLNDHPTSQDQKDRLASQGQKQRLEGGPASPDQKQCLKDRQVDEDQQFLMDHPANQDQKQHLYDGPDSPNQKQRVNDHPAGQDQQLGIQCSEQNEIDGLWHEQSATPVPRYKRAAHKQAEFRRREKIQKGFDLLKSLVPALRSAENRKPSNIKILSECAQYIRDLESGMTSQKDEMENLRAEADRLNKEITETQQKLPPCDGMTAENPLRGEDMLEEYFRSSIRENWKFWIFGFFARPLVSSFTREVSIATAEEFKQTLQEWSDNRLNIVFLRPLAVSLLRKVSTTTSILSDPEKVEGEVKGMMDSDARSSIA